jgi:transcriptional regulator with XRE-family HTH domain
VARAAGNDLTASSPLAERVGSRIRERRTLLRQTLAQAARKAEISVSHLSSIETGANLPSLPILARVAAALDLTLNEVLRDVGGGSAIVVEHVDEQTVAARRISHGDLQLEIATLVAEPGQEGPAPIPPEEAEIFIYVLTGSLEVTVEERIELLHAGDSLTAEESRHVSWRVSGSGRSASIWALGPHPRG